MIGTNIRRLRVARGWTQRDLAKILDTAESYVCKLEAGRVQPRADGILRLSHAFGCTPNDLYGVTAADVQRAARAAVGE